MKFRYATTLLLIISALSLAACDSSTPVSPTLAPVPTVTAVAQIPPTLSAAATPTQAVQPAQPITPTEAAPTSAVPTVGTPGEAVTAVTSSGPAQDTAVVTEPPSLATDLPAPTAVSATATGQDVTALTALAQLKTKALAWQPDARLVMLANVRPGQADKLLGVALGDPNVNEPTPGGLGRNWALIAFSPSTKGAVALSMDGTQNDLVQEGALTDNMVQGLGAPGMEALDLSKLDLSKLVDSDKLPSKAGSTGQSPTAGIALLAPDGLGLGPLPTPQAGGSSPQIAYELFSADPSQQNFVFFDALSGQVVLDSNAP